MSDDELIQAIDMILGGNKKDAYVILKEMVKNEPRNEFAWLWLGDCMEDNSEKKACYKTVLELNPQNPKAIEKMDLLIPPADEPTRAEILSKAS